MVRVQNVSPCFAVTGFAVAVGLDEGDAVGGAVGKGIGTGEGEGVLASPISVMENDGVFCSCILHLQLVSYFTMRDFFTGIWLKIRTPILVDGRKTGRSPEYRTWCNIG